jgi:hypothetical protein
MFSSDQNRLKQTISYFVPVELQRRQFQIMPIFSELASRGLKPTPDGAQQSQPWCKWRGISTYLDCIAFADRSANGLPRGKDLDLEHVTPGQFYSAGTVFFAQALIDNIADWLSDALPLPIKGGERNFRATQFGRELKKRVPSASPLLKAKHAFVEEVNRYRQVWIHTLAGGAMPIADADPFATPETANKFLGVPIDPAINIDEESYAKRVEQCALRNDGLYLYELGVFTSRMFDGGSKFYLDWLRFALDNVK